MALFFGCGKSPLRFPLEMTPARLERGKYLANVVAIIPNAIGNLRRVACRRTTENTD
jgi:hypothetical protein